MYILIEDNTKYGLRGRTISNHEFNRIPLADQKSFKKWSVGEHMSPQVPLTGGAGEILHNTTNRKV